MRSFLHRITWDVFATLLLVTVEEERGFGYSRIIACVMLQLSLWIDSYGIVILRVIQIIWLLQHWMSLHVGSWFSELHRSVDSTQIDLVVE